MLRPQFRIILASASPRRKELLGKIVPEFEIHVSNVDEDAFTGTDPWQTARDLAWAKAQSVYWRDVISIGADTVVALQTTQGEWNQLAKPLDKADAIRMLRELSGKRHAVITAVALVWPGGDFEFSDTAWVSFRELSEPEILAYVETSEPMDKAGAYAIQGGAKSFVEKLEGFESTVIGLPLEVLEMEMLSLGIAEED